MHSITGQPVSHTVTRFYFSLCVCVGGGGGGWWVGGWGGWWGGGGGLVRIITNVMVGNGYGFLKLHNDSLEFQYPN